MSSHDRSLVGSVVERTKPRMESAPSSRFTRTPGRGFPAAQHRFKSAFARARDEVNLKGDVAGSRHTDVPFGVSNKPQKQPSVAPPGPLIDPKPIPTNTDALLHQIHDENMRTIARMSDDDIVHEKRAILEQLGEGTGELLRRVQEARRRKVAKEKEVQVQAELEERAAQEPTGKADDTKGDHKDIVNVASPTPRRVSNGLATKPGVLRVKSLENIGWTVPSPLPATSSTRPSSRTGRKLRFAEVTPDDVHVYESAPISPKRAVFALPPPPDTKDDSIISLGTFRQDAISSERADSTNGATEYQPTRAAKADDEPGEGTPEYIRRRYFPNVPANDPGLAWMEASSLGTTDSSVPRFDLQGVPIPISLSASLPSHLGLHHHAEGSHAGYTIDDIFLLARSTVPAQRASMLGILAKVAHRLGRQVQHTDSPDEVVVFPGQEGQLRNRILAAGLAAIDQKGSLGARAVEVVWRCTVEWDGMTSELEGVELSVAPETVSSLQLDYLLPQITDVLSHAALPPESLAQLLAVLHWLAQQSNQSSDMIISTPRLVRTILDIFLLTPIPPKEESVLPNPLALQMLITLASASRSNASALLDPADALLRFVTPLPPSSPYPPALATTLLTNTLRFYSTLASYGFYSQIVTTAPQIFTDLASYISSIPSIYQGENASDSASTRLRIAWASLIEAWTVCATDPHATSPPHEIVWSQVCALGWMADVRKLREGLSNKTSDWPLYASIWDAEAAWLEGARINGIKGGEKEREEASKTLRRTFSTDDGIEFGIVQRALEAVRRDLGEGGPTTTLDGERALKSLASACNILASALRLWLACLPPLNDGAPLSDPPFALPLSELSALSAVLVKHSTWSLPSTLGATYLRVYLRPMTRFMIQFHRVSRHIPGTTPQLWFAQALVFLSRLLPGDEYYALAMLDSFHLVTPQFIGVEPAGLPLVGTHMDILRPFFEYTVRPEGPIYVAPLQPNTESVSRSSTLRLPPIPSLPGSGDNDNSSDPSARIFAACLPPTRDFLFAPLTHLLRSGVSPVFRAIPGNWTASEVDVVRATLLLAYAARRVLLVHSLEDFVHSPAEVVFACMRVCMLEHGVGTSGMEVEVFRDAEVERLMARLLEPFTMQGRAGGSYVTTPHVHTLEDAATPYLGVTPFYQFYTDLVALYGAVSFGHQMFATLVVAPLAMHYAVDYRRALWCGGDGATSGSGPGHGDGGAGLGDVVKSVRVPLENVVCTGEEGDPREYLYPIERDVAVLGAYVAALVAHDGGAGLEGFLRFVAVHHVACTVWGDLGADEGLCKDETNETQGESESGAKRREEMRARLLRAVLVRGEVDVVRDVVLYRQCQRTQGPFVWPLTCYRGSKDQDVSSDSVGWREQRVAFVRRAVGDDAAGDVVHVFDAYDALDVLDGV
ncbi:hypothetical protein EV363DRAFT_1455547 [Boletus edulis]|nr:hypothetical protein EV363DRAFT_1455547 [Boletus edulis]